MHQGRCFLLWNHAKSCPNSFPLILKHKIRKLITIPITFDSTHRHYTLYTDDIQNTHVFWAGLETIQILPASKYKSPILSNHTILDILPHTTPPPAETHIPESKYVWKSTHASKIPLIQTKIPLTWNPSDATIRDSNQMILPVPRYETWKELISISNPISILCTLKWNSFLKKY